MKSVIRVNIEAEADSKKESAALILVVSGHDTPFAMDVMGSALLRISPQIPDLAQDFLCIASCVYAADKAVSRAKSDDRWTRDISIEIPVEHEAEWSAVSTELSECISFLTGDSWEITFRHGEKRLIQKRAKKRRLRRPPVDANAVCLFSGGLDSFIGAVDWLTDNPTSCLMLVSHYDGDVTGPKKDQCALEQLLRLHFPQRYSFAQTRVGLSSQGKDTNFRSRSLLFLALGCYYAEILGPTTPILIPENGPIALNFPLTPSRRGSCSTRTVHPYFIQQLNQVFAKIGIRSTIRNPYELKTKGEMVLECRDKAFLAATYATTRSCAKFHHRHHWANAHANACGVCIPCLFRRAALHRAGWDNEAYGIRFEALSGNAQDDVLALEAFVKARLDRKDIARGLLANGRLAPAKLPDYVALIERMRTEVRDWMSHVRTPAPVEAVS